ncbi:MAG: nucleotidyltransferase family protein [Candidatus Melainabacteria bacterium]|nr:nucleotidyltransferase family protein [Candidatus Melainabacteria bacterium]
MKAIVLAGGLGTRLGLQDIPKPMYKVNGKPLLEYNILLLRKHNIKEICIALHYMPEIIKNYFKDGKNWEVEITYSLEKEPLGTAGAVRNAQGFIGNEQLLVIYGDNFSNFNLGRMMSYHNLCNPFVTIGIFDPDKSINSKIAGGYVIVDENNNVLSFSEGEKNMIPGYKSFVNAGIYILEPEVLDMIQLENQLDFGKDIFPEILKRKKTMKAFLTNDFVIAIDTKDALNIAENLIQSKKLQ